MIYAVVRMGVRLLAWIVLGRRLRIRGMGNIPHSGAVLVVGNHVGTVEPPLTGVFIPRLDVFYMAKSELFTNPVLGWLFRQNHVFPVIRDSADRTALRHALEVLAGGHVLLVYPEGHAVVGRPAPRRDPRRRRLHRAPFRCTRRPGRQLGLGARDPEGVVDATSRRRRAPDR